MRRSDPTPDRAIDILSHGLWAGAAAGWLARDRPLRRGTIAATVALGMLPDAVHLLPVAAWALFEPGTAAVLGDYIRATPGNEPAMPGAVGAASHHLHCIFHSAVVLGLLSFLVAWKRRAALAVLAGWWLHIALDIPTHSGDFYPVPFLYPFTYWGVDGIAWTTPWVLGANYAALALAYAVMLRSRSSRRAEGSGTLK